MFIRPLFAHWHQQLQTTYKGLPYQVWECKASQVQQTWKSVNDFFELRSKGELKERVEIFDDVTLVDGVLQIISTKDAAWAQGEAAWSKLHFACKSTMAVAALAALLGVRVSVQRNLLLILVGMICTVVASLFAGNILATYLPVDQQLQARHDPGSHFLERRDADLKLTFAELLKKGCRIKDRHPDKGTVTDLELLWLWHAYFADFAHKYLDIDPKTEDEQNKWIENVKKANPVAISIFINDLDLMDRAEWKRVRGFMEIMNSLLTKRSTYPQLRQGLEDAKLLILEGKKPVQRPSAPIQQVDNNSANVPVYDGSDDEEYSSAESDSEGNVFRNCKDDSATEVAESEKED